jgi:colanic acid/amylovoran biosynthesis protein
MRRIAQELIAGGWRCVALSTCQGVAGYTVDDSVTARTIFDGLPVQIDAGFHTPTQLVEQICGADLVIATRMHFAILSLISGKPVHAIAYEPKTLELLRGLGFPEAVTPIEQVSEEWAAGLGQRDALEFRTAQLDATAISQLNEAASQPARDTIRRLTTPVRAHP